MKIRSKLLLGFSLLLMIILILGFINLDRLKYMNTQLDSIYSGRYLMIKNSTGMRGDINDLARISTNLVQIQDEAKITAGRKMIESKQESAMQHLSAIKSMADTAEERRLIIINETSFNEFIKYVENLLDLLEKGQYEGALSYRISNGQELQDELLNSLNDTRDYFDAQIETEIANTKQEYNRSINIMIITMVLGLLIGIGVVLWVLPSIARGLFNVSGMIRHFAQGNLEAIMSMPVPMKDEIGEVAATFKEMTEDLIEKQEIESRYMKHQEDQSWLNKNLARINELLHGKDSLDEIAQMFISEFTPVLGASYGTLYVRRAEENPNELQLCGSYSRDDAIGSRDVFNIGEGLIGQAAMDKKPIFLLEAPADYVSVRSGLGGATPPHILIYPVMFEEEVLGVVELAKFNSFTPLEEQLLSKLADNLGIILNNIMGRIRVEELLRESQAMTEELQVQSEELQTHQEELRRSNEQLGKQTEALKRSEELLQRQQEELEHYNTELIAKTRALEEQVHRVEEKNNEIEETKRELEQHASQLAVTSKYKSEFLANMSHELRTPLNSLLILSQLLSENKENNLSPKQVEYAQTIHASGSDLLKMIDEILDLSKVDAGKMEINEEIYTIHDLTEYVKQNYGPVAMDNNIGLRIEVADSVPEQLRTDGHRVKQIIRNLLSNAFKFTNHGYISLIIDLAESNEVPQCLDSSSEYIALKVKDTGIGIPEDKLELIFGAFQQVDGTTSRNYGGTGLGLSISRGLAELLGGGIAVESVEGKGSQFTLFLPKEPSPELFISDKEVAAAHQLPVLFDKGEPYPRHLAGTELELSEPIKLADDRDDLSAGDKILLIIEDDIHFAQILQDMSHEHGFKSLVAVQGDEGLEMARKYLPEAIILDIQLPVMDGWAILNELKSSADTRHIPVHVISVVDDVKQGLIMGAIAYLKKPSSREQLEKAFNYIESYTEKDLKYLLIVEDDAIQRQSITALIGHDDVVIKAVSTGKEAIQELMNRHYDCMVLDLMLTDMTGFQLLDKIRDNENLTNLPIIIYTGKDLDGKEEMKLRKYAESIIIKDVKSPERLLDETTLFLHRVEADLPEDKRRILQKLHNKEELFEKKKILLVDDDVRNVFALSSVLESYRMNVVFAENGREALDILQEHKDFDLVLMDMMMPEMDGYEAMRRIREMPEYKKLPIIALTAKAMKEDRSKCIEAGASDYVKKPIQTDQLLSLMRVWLYS